MFTTMRLLLKMILSRTSTMAYCLMLSQPWGIYTGILLFSGLPKRIYQHIAKFQNRLVVEKVTVEGREGKKGLQLVSNTISMVRKVRESWEKRSVMTPSCRTSFWRLPATSRFCRSSKYLFSLPIQDQLIFFELLMSVWVL